MVPWTRKDQKRECEEGEGQKENHNKKQKNMRSPAMVSAAAK